MQWPDATASAADAAGFEAVGVIDEDTVVASVGGIFSVGVPSGLDLPCTEDPELFFAEAPADVEAAKALCQGCAVRAECFAGAIERREPWGVWGGELLLRGTIVPRKRPRGRPRKEDVAIDKAAEQAA